MGAWKGWSVMASGKLRSLVSKVVRKEGLGFDGLAQACWKRGLL